MFRSLSDSVVVSWQRAAEVKKSAGSAAVGIVVRQRVVMPPAWKLPGSPSSTHTDLATSPRSGSGSPRGKTRHSAAKLTKPDAHAETADPKYQEVTSVAMKTAQETSQSGSDAKRHLASGHEGEVLQLVQKYLPPELAEAYRTPEDNHLMQREERPGNGTPVSPALRSARAGAISTMTHCHSYKNPLYKTTADALTDQQQEPQQDDAPIQPVTQVPVARHYPCRLAQPVTMPELKTAVSRSSTGSWRPIGNVSSPLSSAQAADTTSQQTTTVTPSVGTTSVAASLEATVPTQQPFAASQPTTGAISPRAIAEESLMIRPLSSTLLPAVGTSGIISSDTLRVLGAWHAIYCPNKEAQLQAALTAYYDPQARFEDNFVQVFGREQIGVQFYAIRRGVKDIDVHIEKVEVLNSSEQTTTAAGANGFAGILSTLSAKPQTGTYQLRIISRIAFHLPAFIRGPLTSWFLPPAVDMWATDILTVRQSDNKIVHHQQRVHNVPVGPWPLRACLGLSSSLFFMHVLGW